MSQFFVLFMRSHSFSHLLSISCSTEQTTDYKSAGAVGEAVKMKYFDDFAKTKDLHFFLVTSQVHYFKSQNPLF